MPLQRSASLSVTPRANFAFSAQAAQPESNGFVDPNGTLVQVPNPPVANQETGLADLLQVYNAQPTTIDDGGPNNGYQYVATVSNQKGAVGTAFYYVTAEDLLNITSVFYQAQCGNYDASTNPGGFISGADLQANTIRHEAGTTNSHYAQYVTAQDTQGNNVGSTAESRVGAPKDSQFPSEVTTSLNAAQGSILNAMEVQPCSANYGIVGGACVYEGGVNYAPYASCK